MGPDIVISPTFVQYFHNWTGNRFDLFFFFFFVFVCIQICLSFYFSFLLFFELNREKVSAPSSQDKPNKREVENNFADMLRVITKRNKITSATTKSVIPSTWKRLHEPKENFAGSIT